MLLFFFGTIGATATTLTYIQQLNAVFAKPSYEIYALTMSWPTGPMPEEMMAPLAAGAVSGTV